MPEYQRLSAARPVPTTQSPFQPPTPTLRQLPCRASCPSRLHRQVSLSARISPNIPRADLDVPAQAAPTRNAAAQVSRAAHSHPGPDRACHPHRVCRSHHSDRDLAVPTGTMTMPSPTCLVLIHLALRGRYFSIPHLGCPSSLPRLVRTANASASCHRRALATEHCPSSSYVVGLASNSAPETIRVGTAPSSVCVIGRWAPHRGQTHPTATSCSTVLMSSCSTTTSLAASSSSTLRHHLFPTARPPHNERPSLVSFLLSATPNWDPHPT
jgi:hypothetical protein